MAYKNLKGLVVTTHQLSYRGAWYSPFSPPSPPASRHSACGSLSFQSGLVCVCSYCSQLQLPDHALLSAATRDLCLLFIYERALSALTIALPVALVL